jgi:hypothetical protein
MHIPLTKVSNVYFSLSCSGLCAITYFVFGCLCLDRFTSRAFLSTNDPVVSTAIPRPTTVEGVNLERSGAYRSPPDP